MKKIALAAARLAAAALAVAGPADEARGPDQACASAAYRSWATTSAASTRWPRTRSRYDKEEAARNADLVVQRSSTVPRDFFGEGTDKGETQAKPEIWTEPRRLRREDGQDGHRGGEAARRRRAATWRRSRSRSATWARPARPATTTTG